MSDSPRTPDYGGRRARAVGIKSLIRVVRETTGDEKMTADVLAAFTYWIGFEAKIAERVEQGQQPHEVIADMGRRLEAAGDARWGSSPYVN